MALRGHFYLWRIPMWNGVSKGELMEGLDEDKLWPFIRRLQSLDDDHLNSILRRLMSMIYPNKGRM